MRYLANAFSISMLPYGGKVRIHPIDAETAKSILKGGFVSAIGHTDTARIVGNELGVDVPVNRVNVMIGVDDVLIVAQYTGPRLAEGTTRLPEGAKITYYIVTVEAYDEAEVEQAFKNMVRKDDVVVHAAILNALLEVEKDTADSFAADKIEIAQCGLNAIIRHPEIMPKIAIEIERILRELGEL